MSGAITMIDKAVNNELSLDAQFCVGCLLSVKQVLEKVLAVPLRNCDVGTAEEQSKRMEIYCKAHGTDESGCYRCESCTFLRTDQCGLAWAQMPYEDREEGAK